MSVFYDEGNYSGQVTDQALSKTKNGVHQFVLRFKVLGVTESYERNIYMFLTDAAMPYTKDSLRKLGFQGQSLAVLDPKHPNPHSFIGKTIEVYCKHEAYENKMQEKWALSSSQGIQSNPPTSSELTTLDRLFSSAGEPIRESKSYQSPATVITDDDIPF